MTPAKWESASNAQARANTARKYSNNLGGDPHVAMFRTLFRDLLGSPLDHWQRESIFINENDTNRKLEQQEKRLGEMNEIANRQAKDIQELRAAAERSVESAVEISRCAMEQRAREMSIRSDMRSPTANTSEEQWRSALQADGP